MLSLTYGFRRSLGLFALLLVVFLFLKTGSVVAEETKKAENISDLEYKFFSLMDKWTRFKWGPDFVIYIVHYHEDLIDPWVELESIRRGLTVIEASRYRENFIKDLRFDTAEAFLITIENFSKKPISLAPLKKRLFLKLPDGQELPPLYFDRHLEEPILGRVQGIVFFPKQQDMNDGFEIIIKGFYDGKKDITFCWEPQKESTTMLAGGQVVKSNPKALKSQLPKQIIVVDIPVSQQGDNKKNKPKNGSSEQKSKNKLKKPQKPQKPKEPNKPKESSNTPPAWLGEGFKLKKPQKPAPPVKPEQKVKPGKSSKQTETAKQGKEKQKEQPKNVKGTNFNEKLMNKLEFSYSKDKVIKRFVSYWVQRDFDKMYEMLDSQTKKKFTPDKFKKLLRKEEITWALRRGKYKIEQLSGNRFVVKAPQKVLVLRVLRKKVLSLVVEDGQWRIRWQ